MIHPPAPCVARHWRPWGLEVELADGSLWRETVGCWAMVRLPQAYNTAHLRGELRKRGPREAAAWAMPPARPPVALPAEVTLDFVCESCGGRIFAADVSDPRICVRCAAARRRVAQQDASPWRCQRCGRGPDLVRSSPSSPSLCVPCARSIAAAADL